MKAGWRLAVAALTAVTGWAGLGAELAYADMVVVKASAGANLKAGQTLPSGSQVTLPAGGSATLLSQDGRTIALTGPYSGTPDAGASAGGDPRMVTALSRLLTSGGTDTASLGVTRATHIRDAYAMDQNGGLHCQVADRPAVFKRSMVTGQSSLTLISAMGTESEVVWADGSLEAPWPANTPMMDGTYLIRIDSRPNPVKLVVRQVPATVTGPAATAAWMADHGCQAQALAVLDTLK